jgi:hypothetical protein
VAPVRAGAETDAPTTIAPPDVPVRALLLVLVALLAGCSLTAETVNRLARDGAVAEGSQGADGAAGDAPREVLAPDALGDALDDGPGAFDAGDGRVIADAADVLVTEGGCVAQPERCNGVDDDCDGLVDEGLAPMTCGVGACRRAIPSCVGGMPADPSTCLPGSPVAEVCNNVDDDCDGLVDDGIPAPSCGLGACRVTPPAACVGGMPAVCMPRVPSLEVCGNGIDDDCDGVPDDGCVCTRYVAPGGTGSGTSATAPMGSIQAAIDALRTAGMTGTA